MIDWNRGTLPIETINSLIDTYCAKEVVRRV